MLQCVRLGVVLGIGFLLVGCASERPQSEGAQGASRAETELGSQRAASPGHLVLVTGVGGPSPRDVTLRAGDTVLWRNDTAQDILEVSVDGAVEGLTYSATKGFRGVGAGVVTDPLLPPGGLASLQILRNGTYRYTIHAGTSSYQGTLTAK